MIAVSDEAPNGLFGKLDEITVRNTSDNMLTIPRCWARAVSNPAYPELDTEVYISLERVLTLRRMKPI